ncbi:tRNA (adenosine(37)-N6)-threonylcarbamoyltransferase complex ATPase subunit type 1 TsaE [Desulfurispirillum indicum]|uniref:tRNA (adenosine(37)-N6)-threonylcarbamoyltransferase complex ATPase subunit type 1 TsaE n=1 Tax=Desulfurispirillum indicum TaxID=936456 RepID=UPI000676837E|nr:tRNA (adenosine(37)-N6)-threonylcarbamoyltransferase complex ATPase subunit type 1 TsaE [Desulfurispirillum indicum]UCZ56404.1 tRNA (adenosine(37)-N6)-threonylcarbamoyltransferase complex ATPase subunit type 1 TsaE [Desulfurispirillum indicum]
MTTSSEDDTFSLGETIASRIPGPIIIGLKGQLGAGKTTLVKGIARGLGIDPDTVTSPTYSIAQHYEASPHSLCHCDLYRLHSEDDFYHSGIDEMLEDAIAVVEWPEMLPAAITTSSAYGEITLSAISEHERLVSLRLPFWAEGQELPAGE